MTIKLKGTKEVQRNLNSIKVLNRKKSMKGLIECAIQLRRDMVQKPPRIPVDLANLQASWFVVTILDTRGQSAKFTGEEAGEMGGDHSTAIQEAKGIVASKRIPTVVMGFSANYAAYVHEMTDADFTRPKKGKRRRAGAGAKFFETHLFNNYHEFLKILRDNTAIK